MKNNLYSWNEGLAKQEIIEFVNDITREGTNTFVPPSERIAVFDNDGTLWCEKPYYVHLFFIKDRLQALVNQHAEWKEQEPYKSILAGDFEAVAKQGAKVIDPVLKTTPFGRTTEEFTDILKNWLSQAKHPRFNRLFTECVYQPMLELLEYLRANGFKTFIVSGGGIEFMRVWTHEVYGIPTEQVIGSSVRTKFEMREGKPVLVRLPELNFLDDVEGKPVGIHQHIGRRPTAAFGNSDGDLPMLQWTAAGEGNRLMLLVHHTDNQREWAYDRESPVGCLDKALDEAKDKNWTVIDMKKDWKRIFPFESE